MNPIQNEKKQIFKHFFSPYENVYKKIKKGLSVVPEISKVF